MFDQAGSADKQVILHEDCSHDLQAPAAESAPA